MHENLLQLSVSEDYLNWHGIPRSIKSKSLKSQEIVELEKRCQERDQETEEDLANLG